MNVAKADTPSMGTSNHLAAVEAEYARLHPRSREAMLRMARALPGGDTRTTTWFAPFPLVIASGNGASMEDLDGNPLLDFICNYTALVHGHRPPFVVDALEKELRRGFVYAAPIEEQGQLAELISSRIASVDLVRFTNSGTEANMLAMRLARAWTGRQRLAVAEHSYHGSDDTLDWHAAPSTNTVVFPIDDVDHAAATLEKATDLAAIFIEPVLGSGGVLPVSPELLEYLREFTTRTGALLVFDEVMTFRLGYGGFQERLEVAPDLTTLGKAIGGGMPCGAVGGRREVMELTDPRRDRRLHHSGTFNGHRLAMVAGRATLEALDEKSIAKMNRLGERLATGIRSRIEREEAPISVTSVGSMLNVHAAAHVNTPAQAQKAATDPLARYLHLALINQGVFIAARGEMCTSTAMSEETVDQAVDAFAAILEEGVKDG